MKALQTSFYIILLLIAQLTITAQTMDNFTKDWNKTDKLLKKGLVQSANKTVLTIFETASKQNNTPQIIKAAIHLVSFRATLIEESELSNNYFLDSLSTALKSPAKQIVKSLQAELLQNYFNQNRWKFYQRTEVLKENNKDIQTWSFDKLDQTMSSLYKASLAEPTLLQSLPIATFDPIIIKGINTTKLRKTIYELLAHRALLYFSYKEQYITKPNDYFKINQIEAFAPVEKFVKVKFTTTDKESYYYQALQLYQELLAYLLLTNNTDALLDADILRLQFVYNNSTATNKKELYQQALLQISNTYTNSPIATQATYLYAQLLIQLPVTTNTPQQYETAITLCNKAIAAYPTSEGAINCTQLLTEIRAKSLGFQMELVNLPNQPFKLLLEYKNVPTVYVRVIKTTYTEVEKITTADYDKIWKALVNLTPTTTFTINTPKVTDYQSHTAEAKVEALPLGIYVMLMSTTADFATNTGILAKEVFHVSNIGVLRKDNEYHVLHRNTGMPLANAKIKIWENKYDYDTRKYNNENIGTTIADKNGYFKVTSTKNDNRNIQFETSYNGDVLRLLSSFYTTYGNVENEEGSKNTAYLFTDRGIYRPGQIVYYKGIVMHSQRKPFSNTVVPKLPVTIQLLDANSQVIQTSQLTTNEFGSYNGLFTLPTTGLNGQFSIRDSANNGNIYFMMEEYKRPKFSVTMVKPTTNFAINDSIKITGNAKAYSGNNIDGAKVKYTILRKTNYPMWWYGWGNQYGKSGGRYNPYGNRETVQIATGELLTNAEGEFTLTFKAIPDEAVDRKSQPTFNYEITADVTDINGETRIGNITIPVAYQSVQLVMTQLEKMAVDSLKVINLLSNNTMGNYVPTQVKLKLYQLQQPATYLRNRYWQKPDQFILTQKEFKASFPLDIYNNEDEKETWKKTLLLTDTFTTTEAGNYNIAKPIQQQKLQLPAGEYYIEATTIDKSGDSVKALQYVQLINTTLNANFETSIAITPNKYSYQPNDTLSYTLQTSFNNIFAIHEQQFMDNKNTETGNTRYYEQLSNGSKTIQYTVTEADRGGIAASVSFVKYNRVFSTQQTFDVPYTNKELDIQFTTFRDKTLPGSKEEYALKIRGAKGDKLAAELLATMYDASLDQITPYQLPPLDINPRLGYWRGWIGDGNFKNSVAEARSFIPYKYYIYNKSYPFFGIKDKNKSAPLYWINPLDYTYGELPSGSINRGKALRDGSFKSAAPQAIMSEEIAVVGLGSYDSEKFDAVGGLASKLNNNETPNNNTESPPIQVRKNFNETAFFLPNLLTDTNGNVIIKYTIPEALTQWKLMTMAHTKTMALGYATKFVTTQKPLMVQPNLPRFLREGDKIELAVKVVNLTNKEITGTAQLELLNPETNQPVDGWFKNIYANQYFTIAANQSQAVTYTIEIPFGYNKPLIIRTTAISVKPKNGTDSTATTNEFQAASDAEETVVPVLSNRMLVTETLPLYTKVASTKAYTFSKLVNANKPTFPTIGSAGSLTVEYTTNPVWQAVQALPYLVDYPYDCAEQTFSKYYANALASKIANSNPTIKKVMDSWLANGKSLASNLTKLDKLLATADGNTSLKNALLEETPWVVAAQNEAQQKRNIALLFDLTTMAASLQNALAKLTDLQTSNGGFSWFKGGTDDRYITQHILTGIGHLAKLKAVNSTDDNLNQIITKGLNYLDKRIVEQYKEDVKDKYNITIDEIEIQYLYMRSFYTQYDIPTATQTAINYYMPQLEKIWLSSSKYMQGMIALTLHRNGNTKTPKAILQSLKENAIITDELGMYWKAINNGYYWYQAPIETMSLLTEAFNEITNDAEAVGNLQQWLLTNKQTNNWKTTKATAEACYALLCTPNATNSFDVTSSPTVQIKLGNTIINSTDADIQQEAGTGYITKKIIGEKVSPTMGNITITTTANASTKAATNLGGRGAVYWQYLEDLDKITFAKTALKIDKKIYKKVTTNKGKKLVAITENETLQVGNKMVIQMTLKVDRDMEYIHLKDMRSSGTEPLDALSQYKYQDGLSYYQSTKDLSTNFFIGYLPKGTYVLEYTVFVSHKGNFSNGVTTAQCMYAPEFSSHSEGVRVLVD